ncbi:geminin coiled-coil domain-containing protein 1 [Amia ocellicauda]|uniref:geminin coiled-coil domain-containing protein 1 n=1 Tax=Amia ocellicauda TaxID=2972642 RepID=UPI003464A174
MMSAVLSCQDQCFAGGQGYGCPYSVSTSQDGVDVSKETLVSFWAAGLLDNPACQPEPPQQGHFYQLDSGFQNDFSWNDHLSPHVQRNKQLQDTLLQKEEELARLHDENNKLREYLNSAFVKGLEEKTKKLLHSTQRADGKPKNKKRRSEEEGGGFHGFTASQLLPGAHRKRTRRNLSLEFCSAEELACTPSVDSWVLQTLGLKDEDTIDHSANYSANSNEEHLLPPSDPSALQTASAMDYSDGMATALGFCPDLGAGVDYTASLCRLDSHCLLQTPDPTVSHHTPLGSSTAPEPHPSPYRSDISRNKTEVAFTMSLNPHSNVKTHSFNQGQAFVRRDEQGGWKFTWVPKQSD